MWSSFGLGKRLTFLEVDVWANSPRSHAGANESSAEILELQMVRGTEFHKVLQNSAVRCGCSLSLTAGPSRPQPDTHNTTLCGIT